MVIAAILRFVHLGLPNSLVFDEVYYANEGQQLLDHGVEWKTETDSAGNVTASYADYVVHPPLGKWMIAVGIKLVRQQLARTLGWPGLRLAVRRRAVGDRGPHGHPDRPADVPVDGARRRWPAC